MKTGTGRTDSASIVVAATVDDVYRAFANPDALIAWLPPEGMTGKVLEYDFREGGNYRIELSYGGDVPAGVAKTTERTDVSTGRFLELLPPTRIVQSVEFEATDPSFAGQMTLSWSFESIPAGTRVTVLGENPPPGITKADHDAGLQSSLQNLARFLSGQGR